MEHEEIITILTGRLLENDQSPLPNDIREHLAVCQECQRLTLLAEQMDKVPLKQPKASLKNRFDTMLHNEMNKPVRVIPLWVWQAAAACCLLFGGVFIGTQFGRTGNADLTELRTEVRSLKEAVVFNQLNNASAGVRLQAINNVQEIAKPDEQLLTALEHALNTDQNENVRMAAVYALSSYADRQDVRHSLVGALDKETEPVIQVLLINLLTEKKEKSAKGVLKDMMRDPHNTKEVRSIAKKSLQEL